MYTRHANNTHANMYITFIKNTLIEIGLPGVWENQNVTNMTKACFKNYIKTTLQNQFIQKWQSTLDNESIYTIYRMSNVTFRQRPHIRILVNSCSVPIIRFMTTNNNLPINTQRYEGIDRRERLCRKCELDVVGDEFHYIFVCPFFQQKRNELLPQTYIQRPNVSTFEQPINTDDKCVLLKLKHFICIIDKSM